MATSTVPHFQNDAGIPSITIGVKEFKCCGASVPHDHPHVFLDMGADDQIICPYCSTVYKYSDKLSATQTQPDGCLYYDPAA